MPPRDASAALTEEKVPKNKPKASKLRQQKLPAWQPILTASTVIPTVFAVGIIFIPIGIALFLASNSVKEYKLDYTDLCPTTKWYLPPVPCTLQMNIDEDMTGDVYIYYYLENFYQNHRRYVKSRNDKQYLGDVTSVSDCDPFDKWPDASGEKKPIAPCGAVANSMFNDTFKFIHSSGQVVPLTTDGVLWDVDKNKKFKNPPGDLQEAFKGTIRPPNWQKDIWEIGGFENVDFIVWMRTAALPNFRKLWRLVNRNDLSTSGLFANGLPQGTYNVEIMSTFPVVDFNGRKAIVISTTSWAGGKNLFLGIAYLVVGSLAILLGVVFIVIHIKFGHSMAELSNVSSGSHHQ